MPAFRYVSAFAGIGGFELGFEEVGAECVAQIEINRHRQRILARRWPNLLRGENIDDVHGRDLGRADAIIGGFPCQDTTVGSPFRRGVLEGERSGKFWEFRRLIEEYLRIVEETDARWVVIENPDGLLRSPGKVQVCRRCCYTVALNAKRCPRCAEDGVLTRVDRTGWDMAAVLRGLRELGYGVSWRVLDAHGVGSAQRRKRVLLVGHRGGDARPAELVLGDSGAGEGVAATHPVRRGPRRPTAVVGPDPASGVLIFRKSANPRASLKKGGYETWVPEGDDGFTNTLAGFDGGAATRQKHLLVYPDGNIRTLTLGEWERLQGLPDGWTEGMPETERFNSIGDAMNVPMAAWFGRRLAAVHAAVPMIPAVA